MGKKNELIVQAFLFFPLHQRQEKSLLQPLDTSCVLRAGLLQEHACKRGQSFLPFQSQLYLYAHNFEKDDVRKQMYTPEFGEMKIHLCSLRKKN